MQYMRHHNGRLRVSAWVLVLSLGLAAFAVWDMPAFIGLPLLAALGLHYVWRDKQGHPLHRLVLLGASGLAAIGCAIFGLYFLMGSMRYLEMSDPYAALMLFIAFVMGFLPAMICAFVFVPVLHVALATPAEVE